MLSDFKFYIKKEGWAVIIDFGLWSILLYRIGHFLYSLPLRKLNPFWYIYLIFYQLQLLFLKIELPASAQIGKNLFLPHPYGIVMGGKTIIKDNVKIGPWVVLGHNFDHKNPIIEDNCYIGPHSCILGGVVVGKNSTIGAGAVVTKNVSPNSIVYLASLQKSRSENE